MLWLAASVSLAQSTPQATVEGIVSNSVTGASVSKAHVTLIGSPNGAEKKYGAVTGADGRFSITSVDPGAYSLAVERVGFVSPADSTNPLKSSMVLRPGEHREDAKLELTPAGVITGRVVDAAGEPVELTAVRAEGREPGAARTGRTGGDGQFRIGGLRPGRYRVRALVEGRRLPPEIRTDGTTEIHYASTYYPSSLEEESAGLVTVPAGGEVGGVIIQLASAPIVRVSGVVSGIPPGAERTTLLIRERGSESSVAIRPDGSFEFWRLDPGKCTVSALLDGPDRQALMSAPVTIDVGVSNIDNISLALVPRTDITGRIEYDDPQARPPSEDREQTEQQGTPSPGLVLRLPDGTLLNQTKIAADGSFLLERVMPGIYRAGVSWRKAYVKSMRLGATEVSGAILDLRYGSGGAALSVVVSSATGSVSGIVRNDSGPAAGARVALVADDAEIGIPPRFTLAGADGAYTLDGITPGKYRLVAVDSGDSIAVMQGNGLQDYQKVMEPVEIREHDNLSKDLKLRMLGEK